MLVGTKLQHVVSSLALEIVEPKGPSNATHVKPRDDLFWFGKPEILLQLIQFIIFQVTSCAYVLHTHVSSLSFWLTVVIFLAVQNAFEMATYIWALVRLIIVL